MKPAAEFIRVSTGSQDESSQVKMTDGYADAHGFTIVKRFVLHGYSASKGEQEPALLEVIADMERGDYATLIVTESSRLDRRGYKEQAKFLFRVSDLGGEVISITEPAFGKDDMAGTVATALAQLMNAEKSRTVRNSTYRGISMIRDNGAHHGPLPLCWESRGERYAKRAYCTDPAAVADIYERVADREPLRSIGRRYAHVNGGRTLYPQSIVKLVRFAANHTGVIECRYTHNGETETWAHEVAPVVDSALWWRANRVLDANLTEYRANKGGRPVAKPANWISGILDCPGCGAKLYVRAGATPATDWRTGKPRDQKQRAPKLRCGGTARDRVSCGRFKGIDAQPVIDLVAGMFAGDDTPVLAFQRVAGNAHELDALNASLRKIQARLSATEDDDQLDALIAERKAAKARIAGFAVVPDSYDYAPTGQTVAGMWNDGDDAVRRGMARAVKNSWGMSLVNHEGRWQLAIGREDAKSAGDDDGIVDLGNGLCFRRETA